MISAAEAATKVQEILGRDLEADELYMLGRLLKANEGDADKDADWYAGQLLELIESERQDVPDEQLPKKTYWVEPNRVVEVG